MKKTLATILVLSLIVALSACGELATTHQKQTESTTAATQPTEKQTEPPTTTPTQPPETEPAETQPVLPETQPVLPETQPVLPETEPAAKEDKPAPELVQTQPVTERIAAQAQPSAPETKPAETEPVAEETKPAETEPVVEETQPVTEPVIVETQPPETAPPATKAPTQPPAPETKPAETQTATRKAISKEEAIKIALNAAGLKKEEVTDLEAELDKERENLYWEVSFETREKEYDYEIHAYDGTVVKAETEKEKPEPTAPKATTPPTQPPAPETKPVETQAATRKVISKEEAIGIALNAAGLKKEEVTDLEAELDKERENLYWEVSFETREKEYDYEIHAYGGTVVKAETEKEKPEPTAPKATTPPTQPPAPETKPVETQAATRKVISKEEAIEIALKAAGLTKNEIADLEAERDEERKVSYWEISFETRKAEYSYEINAEDGTIIKAEIEEND